MCGILGISTNVKPPGPRFFGTLGVLPSLICSCTNHSSFVTFGPRMPTHGGRSPLKTFTFAPSMYPGDSNGTVWVQSTGLVGVPGGAPALSTNGGAAGGLGAGAGVGATGAGATGAAAAAAAAVAAAAAAAIVAAGTGAGVLPVAPGAAPSPPAPPGGSPAFCDSPYSQRHP